MDDLSNTLNAVQARSIISIKCINHLMYADDLCSFASSFDGLQDLVNVSCKYVELQCIVFYASKSMGMIFQVLFSKYFCLNCMLVIQLTLPTPLKCLGIHLHQSLTYHNDIMRQI